MINLEREVYNLASASLETRRIPDPYFYKLNQGGKLVSAYTGELVEDSIETFSYLGRVEFAGFQSLQRWFSRNESGRAVWISPPYPGQYDATKIIVSEIIKNGEIKLMFNRAVVLDELLSAVCLSYAREIGLVNADSTEEVRKTPIGLTETTDWLELLGKYVEISEIRRIINSGQDKREKERAIARIRSLGERTKLAEYVNLLGDKPLRCQRFTAFQTLFKDAFSIGGTFDCPKCQGPIPSGRGITSCPHCGARKEEALAVCV